MSRSSHKPITGKTKSCIKNGIMETPELLGKGWETPDINWFIRILSHQ